MTSKWSLDYRILITVYCEQDLVASMFQPNIFHCPSNLFKYILFITSFLPHLYKISFLKLFYICLRTKVNIFPKI